MSALPAEERLLPEDRTSPEAALECDQLATELRGNAEAISALEQTIHGERGSNQATVYFGLLLFPPLAAAAETADGEKEQLSRLQERRDRLFRLSAAKRCSNAGTNASSGT